MALKPTIYKLKLSLSDMDRERFESFNLTIAQHPSETLERMIVRILAFCLNADERLVFTKGLSSVEEPDLWLRSLDGQTMLWIDVGEPSVDRVKKASRLAKSVSVYSFNSKSDAWWQINSKKLSNYSVDFFQFNWTDVQNVLPYIERTMDWSITISEGTLYLASESGNIEITPRKLR